MRLIQYLRDKLETFWWVLTTDLVCGWCNRTLRPRLIKPRVERPASHGICWNCLEREFPQVAAKNQHLQFRVPMTFAICGLALLALSLVWTNFWMALAATGCFGLAWITVE